MPKRPTKRTMRGGFLDTLSNWGTSLTQGASNLWQKTKDATTTGITSYTPVQQSIASQPVNNTATYTGSTTTYGGKTRRRKMKGGYENNISSSNLASNSAPFSGPTAQPHNLVGGRSRKNRRNHKKSNRHRRKY